MTQQILVSDSRTIVTAGVYAVCDGLFVFQVGPTKSGEALGVVRLGGHREEGETGWECAVREAWEEACIRVRPRAAPATYWVELGDERTFCEGGWDAVGDEIAPVVVSTRGEVYMTPIYLGYSDDVPRPGSETRALLLLRRRDIAAIVRGGMTLGQYLGQGGRAVFREELSEQLVLQAFPHLRYLHRLLHLYPEIAEMK